MDFAVTKIIENKKVEVALKKVLVASKKV